MKEWLDGQSDLVVRLVVFALGLVPLIGLMGSTALLAALVSFVVALEWFCLWGLVWSVVIARSEYLRRLSYRVAIWPIFSEDTYDLLLILSAWVGAFVFAALMIIVPIVSAMRG